VYDPFLGSGTTIIACERLSRKCRAMEIDPGYVAVAIQRWADATGKMPKLLSA
jgi:DNA modification methylase